MVAWPRMASKPNLERVIVTPREPDDAAPSSPGGRTLSESGWRTFIEMSRMRGMCRQTVILAKPRQGAVRGAQFGARISAATASPPWRPSPSRMSLSPRSAPPFAGFRSARWWTRYPARVTGGYVLPAIPQLGVLCVPSGACVRCTGRWCDMHRRNGC